MPERTAAEINAERIEAIIMECCYMKRIGLGEMVESSNSVSFAGKVIFASSIYREC
jgi:hypothetical protein